MEKLIYIEFYVAGDCVFSCQKSWLPNEGDVEVQKLNVAKANGVDGSMVTWAEKTVEFPVSLPEGYMDDLLKGTGVSL